MNNIEIKITGSGTLQEITESLESIVQTLQYYESDCIDGFTIEDSILYTEFKEIGDESDNG